MHFEIRPALKQGKQLTRAQKSSSFFSEAPVIAGRPLRRGTVLNLTPEQMDGNMLRVRQLMKGGAITVELVDGDKHIAWTGQMITAEQPKTVEPKKEEAPVETTSAPELPPAEKTPETPKASKKSAKAAPKVE